MSERSNNSKIEIDLYRCAGRDTKDAFCVSLTGRSGDWIFIPKSQARFEDDHFVMPEWLARDKGFLEAASVHQRRLFE